MIDVFLPYHSKTARKAVFLYLKRYLYVDLLANRDKKMKKSLTKYVLISGLFMSCLSQASTPTIHWKLNDSSSSGIGISELRFPMSFSVTPDKAGVYFAYYITLQSYHIDQFARPYTGFQPVAPRIAGEHTFKAIFSSFDHGAEPKDNHCGYGADGGPGVSCSVEFEAKLNRFYSIRLTAATKDEDNFYYYSGDVYDDSTNQQVAHIGSFTIPLSSGAGLFTKEDDGFIEPYLSGACSQTISAKYGQVTGYYKGKKYVGDAVTGQTPTTGTCMKAIFTPSTKTKITDVKVGDTNSD